MASWIINLFEKTSDTSKDKYLIPYESIADTPNLAKVATSGSYNDLANKPSIPDVSGKANLAGGNSWTGTQTFTAPNSSNYSINASGYVKGSWLQATSPTNKGSNTGKVCVFDNDGWVYYRTPAEILSEAGGAKSSDIPDVSKMVTTDTDQYDMTGSKSWIGDDGEISIHRGSMAFSAKRGDTQNLGGFGINNGGDNTCGGWSVGADVAHLEIGLDGACDVELNGNAGKSGQVLTSQGANTTPIWTNIPDISGKANLKGGNGWTGNQQFNQGGYWFATDTNHPFVVELENGDELVKVNPNGVSFDSNGLGTMPFLLNGNAGTSGQVLTSQGAGKTPIWKDAPSGGATDAVKYTAQSLTTSQKTQARTNIGAGTGTVSGVAINGLTRIPSSTGLIDLGYNKIKVNGTTYTSDSSGLIDLGTIGGGTTTYAQIYNDIY